MAALSPQSRGSVLTCKDTTNGSVEASDDRAERLLRLVLGSWTERVEGNQLPAEQDWEPDHRSGRRGALCDGHRKGCP